MNVYENYKTILNKGKKVLLLKSGGACNCYSENILNEPDVHCPKCKGTGFLRTKILTEKIRYGFLDIKKDTNIEKQSYEKIKNSVQVFYFPFNYDHIDMKDIIVVLKHDSSNKLIYPYKEETFFKVIDKKENIIDDFKYIKIVAEKINGIGTTPPVTEVIENDIE